jgi:hypothetical protein
MGTWYIFHTILILHAGRWRLAKAKQLIDPYGVRFAAPAPEPAVLPAGRPSCASVLAAAVAGAARVAADTARATTERFGVPPSVLLSERHVACFGVLVFWCLLKKVLCFMHIGKIKKIDKNKVLKLDKREQAAVDFLKSWSFMRWHVKTVVCDRELLSYLVKWYEAEQALKATGSVIILRGI